MEVSSNYSRYDTPVQSTPSRIPPLSNRNSINKLSQNAYKIDISARGRASAEFNDPTITFPVHDSEVLQYSQNLELTYK